MQYASAGCQNIVLSPKNQWMRFMQLWCSTWMRLPHENCLTQCGICSHTQTWIKANGRRTVCLMPQSNHRPGHKNAGNLAGPAWCWGEVPRYGKVVEIWEGHVGVWPTDEWSRVDPDEGSCLITCGRGVMVHQWSGKLFPLPLCGTSGLKALTTSSHGANHKIHASWGRVITVHINRLGVICWMGHWRSTRLVMPTKPSHGPHDTLMGWGSGGDPTDKTQLVCGGRAFHGIQGRVTSRLHLHSRDHRANITGRGHHLQNKLNMLPLTSRMML